MYYNLPYFEVQIPNQILYRLGSLLDNPSFRNMTPNQMAELPPGFTVGETKKLCFSLLTPEARNIFRKTGLCIQHTFYEYDCDK